jgi:hypothetical protein
MQSWQVVILREPSKELLSTTVKENGKGTSRPPKKKGKLLDTLQSVVVGRNKGYIRGRNRGFPRSMPDG